MENISKAVNTIRMLAVDAVEKANSGHPGMPMGMADCAFVLWYKFMRFNPRDPQWLNRDRFVLSAGHGSMLLYALLHLFGYDVSLDDLKAFRQWNSRTPGHPEHGRTPGVETTTGPLGQGFANGVGMAIAARMMAERFDRDLFDHRIYGIVSDGDLMEGVSSEAASLAGFLKLGNIVYIYDDNHITIEGRTDQTFSEDVAKRFEAYGWHIIRIDGHQHAEIERAIQSGISETSRPTLIIARTHIGFGSPNKQDNADSHGSPLGAEEVLATKRNLNWPEQPAFFVPDEVTEICHERVRELSMEYEHWTKSFLRWKNKHVESAALLDAMLSRRVPDTLEEQLIKALPGKPMATRVSSGKIMQKVAELMPGLCGGSADLTPSTKTRLDGSPSVTYDDFKGRNFHFGIREHAMGSILNGMALYGGLIPYGSTFLIFSDYMRPPIRLAALMGLQVIYIFTHDSIFVGEDGPTHQPVEQIAVLRAIPNLTVIRPADSLEVAMAWACALRKLDGPTALMLTRQNVPDLERLPQFDPKLIQNGAYIIAPEKEREADIVIIATGSEVAVALGSRKILETQGHSVRVVSMPSVEIFRSQAAEYRQSVIPANDSLIVVVEAGTTFGWHGIAERPVHVIGIDRFGASAPYQVLAEQFGLTAEKVAERITSIVHSQMRNSNSGKG